MKKKDLYDALSGINEKYLSDSENFSEISTEFRRAKVRKISIISSLCGCSIILAVVFFSFDVMENNFNDVPELIEKSNIIQTDIADSSDVSDNSNRDTLIITDEDRNEIQSITEITEISSEYPALTENTIADNIADENYVESSEEPITTYISDVNGNPVIEHIQTEISVIEASKTPTTDVIISTDFDGITENYDKTDFSGICIDEWLENPDVIWSENDTKGYLSSEYISMGSIKISEKLSDFMQNNPDNTVYAVMVDFSSCIDENELLDWKYNGDTIADLKMQISEATEYSENSYTYVGSDGIEHVEYFLTSESEVKVTEFERRINEIKSAYRDAKIQDFMYSFHDNGIEIYTDRINGVHEENFCFYTFATRKHLEEFKCKNNEAFIFYPANYFK